MYADQVFLNGKIYTLADEHDQIEGFAVRDHKIIASGTNEQMRQIDAEEVVDLGGRVVLPGFIDAHQHLLCYAQGLAQVDLKGCTSLEELQKRLRKRVEETPKGGWVQGFGFDHEIFEHPVLPTKADLDAVSTENPILISRYCMHIHVANSLALREGKVGENGEEPEKLGRDETGALNGILREGAVTAVLNQIPDPYPTYEATKDVLAKACQMLSAVGITGVHPIQATSCDAFEYLKLYQDLDREGRLPVRAYVSFDEFPGFGMKTGFGNDKVKYGFYKIFTDGSLGSRNAALYEPYSDDPGNCGVLIHTQEELTALCQKAYDMDLQIGIHAIGDKALGYVLTALETVYFSNPKPDQRFRIIHAQCCNPSLLERMKKLPVVIDIQPRFTSAGNIDWSIDRLGPERIQYAYPWKTYIKNGLLLTGSSDSPVEPYDPFLGIFSVVCRQAVDGHPEGGWHPEERVTVYEALCMYTKNAAYAAYEEDSKGTLEPGKLADFVVVSDDPFQVELFHLKDLFVYNTYLGGEEVYARDITGKRG